MWAALHDDRLNPGWRSCQSGSLSPLAHDGTCIQLRAQCQHSL